jgi:hypothetical protein
MGTNDFQRFASEQGEHFRDACVKALTYAGFDVIGTEFAIPDVGITLDIHVRNRRSIDFLIECKGSMRGPRPGCMRTDTVKKAISNAVLLSWSQITPYFPPMILMTSHVAESGDALAMLRCVPTNVILDVIHPWNHGRQLAIWLHADEAEIRRWIERHQWLGSIIEQSWRGCSGIAAD